MKFSELINIIKETDTALKQRALVAVNQSVTYRNWLTGFYIVEFEQNGEDKAEYGSHLIERLAKPLVQDGIKAATDRDLRKYRQFYLTYPQIWMSLTSEFENNAIWMSLSSKFNNLINNSNLTKVLQKAENINEYIGVKPQTLINRISFSHIAELIKVDNPVKRAFYEIECIQGNWSVRELQRQIGSLLFERTGLSKNKDKVIELANNRAVQLIPEDIIRDPYFFEFIGLKQTDVFQETDLEDLLIRHLQDFLLELGKGFCFEARQRRITIGSKHYYVDLVFYHKILKCNIIIELKNRDFEHADISQLNLYLNYYRKNELHPGDNPPVGILLCTGKDDELVEYATEGWDKTLFVSQFQVSLPTEAEFKDFIHKQKRLGLIL